MNLIRQKIFLQIQTFTTGIKEFRKKELATLLVANLKVANLLFAQKMKEHLHLF